MLQILERAAVGRHGTLKLTLPFQDRQRSRLRVLLSSGEEAALVLPRGTVLRGGDLLALSDGRLVSVEAAAETVSTVRAVGDHGRPLARAAYHLGNRHVALEIGEGHLRYLHDHVLDAMVRELGLEVSVERAPFEPESGAYGRHGHAHAPGGHEHAHSHGHGHAPSHAHDHAHEQAAHAAHHHDHVSEHADAIVDVSLSSASAERRG